MKKLLPLLAILLLPFMSEAQLNMSLLGRKTYSQDLNDIWGYAANGKEYALVGTVTGTSIVDITDPTNPTELHFISGATSTWRDIKVWENYMYVTNESSGGLLIVDLTNVDDTSTPISFVRRAPQGMTSAHDIYIDESGVGHILGADYLNGGDLMIDIAANPWNPPYLGVYDEYYLHDAYAKGDTLWGGAVYAGLMVIVDVSDPTSPQTIGAVNTTSNFTHNVWATDNNNYAFTTDETSNANIDAYDVSDPTDIQLLDTYQSSPGENVIPHNTFVKGSYIFTSYYTDGVTVADISCPDNVVEVGNYDTAPNYSGDGFNGCWGVYPYLPSGRIIASDIEEGLYVLDFDYSVAAAHLSGTVRDANTNATLNGVLVNMTSEGITTTTDFTGMYKIGLATAGNYDLTFSKGGYITQTINNVNFVSGTISNLDVLLDQSVQVSVSGSVIEEGTGTPIANADVWIYSSTESFMTTANGSGQFSFASVSAGTYDIVAGSWGHITKHVGATFNSNGTTTLELTKGYYDDFVFTNDWTVSGNASAGIWEKGEPIGTSFNGTESNMEDDLDDDFGNECFMTGNGGGSAGNDDVDAGTTTLTSPVFDLSSYSNPYIAFDRWFLNAGGQNAPDDALSIILNNGNTTVNISDIFDGDQESQWIHEEYKISDFITPTANMTLIVETFDLGGGHLVEAGLDRFQIGEGAFVANSDVNVINKFNLYPSPATTAITMDIEMTSNIENAIIRITNAVGQEIVTETLNLVAQNQLTYDVSQFAAGIYFVEVLDNNNSIYTSKFIVE